MVGDSFTPLQSAGMSLAICLMGFGGGLVMSAIKRDRGVKDWGASIAGTRRRARPDRLAVFLRAGVLPPDAVLLHKGLIIV